MVDCIYTLILFLSSICLQSLSIVPLLLFLSHSLSLFAILLFISALNDRLQRRRRVDGVDVLNFSSSCHGEYLRGKKNIDWGKLCTIKHILWFSMLTFSVRARFLPWWYYLSYTSACYILLRRRRRLARCRTQTRAHFSHSSPLRVYVYFTYPAVFVRVLFLTWHKLSLSSFLDVLRASFSFSIEGDLPPRTKWSDPKNGSPNPAKCIAKVYGRLRKDSLLAPCELRRNKHLLYKLTQENRLSFINRKRDREKTSFRE